MDYFTYLRTTYTGMHKDDDDDVHDYSNDADDGDGNDGDDDGADSNYDSKIVRIVIILTLNYVIISELKKLCRHEEVTIKYPLVNVNLRLMITKRRRNGYSNTIYFCIW